MPSRTIQATGVARSRSPSPSESFDSTLSSSSTLYSPTTDSSPPPSAPPTVVATPPSMYSNSGTRPRRLTPPQRLLGAIDEDSPTVQPDLPLSSSKQDHPVAKLHVYAALVNSKHRTTIARTGAPPTNDFDMVTGPNGEKFTDLRLNRRTGGSKGWKKFMCFG
ncbi:hypothetical protein A1O7_02346 [Cladophialophora yegresii CBS 114405]|uniref:Uncharacterized protein n=1 Tax=Cladophialophora yegresii CBS 114405 TaxID=1182544 RepID=W9WAA5_9EURO|nr:uncharacterized protein A1O7_02346 [Cladophialophora yegresii CBS 114405]EXJ61915.1 hypothetical protein A1O7_02346 [Cladophialophora yegresii CBS 114405]